MGDNGSGTQALPVRPRLSGQPKNCRRPAARSDRPECERCRAPPAAARELWVRLWSALEAAVPAAPSYQK